MSLVSVIMSVYNAELDILKDSVESILSQEYNDFEFIIINDTNSIKVDKYLDSMKKKDPRIVIINNDKNIGLTNSLIKGIKFSKGKYIARQDVDDISFSDRLKLQVQYLENNTDTSLIGTWYITEYYNQLTDYYRYLNNSEELKNQMLYTNPICHASAMFTRKHYGLTNGYNPKYKTVQDLDLWLSLAKIGNIGMIEKILVKRRIMDSSLSVSNKAYKQVFNSLLIRLNHYQNHKKSFFSLIKILMGFIYHLIITVVTPRLYIRILNRIKLSRQK